MSNLEPVTRPNGKTYRPRKLSAAAVSDADDNLVGVVVFGTHTLTPAVREMAEQYVAWQIDSGYAPAEPELVWWRSGYAYGDLRWIDDPEHGRAGVYFREIVEVTR